MQATIVNEPENGFVVNDTITFKVEITVYGELEASAPVITAFQNTVPTLSKDLKNLIEDESHCDVTIIVYSGINHPRPKRLSKTWTSKPSFKIPCNSREDMKNDSIDSMNDVGMQVNLRAHKCILVARSPVFAAMFRAGMSEEATRCIIIDDIEVNVMRALLEFIYSDTIDPKLLESYAELLLIAAAKYQIMGLVTICESYLCIHITNETALTLLKLADDVPECEKLKKNCLQFISQHPQEWNGQEMDGLDGDLLREVQTIIDNSIKKNNKRFSLFSDGEKKMSSFCLIQ